MEHRNYWKTLCDPQLNGGLSIPSVKRLFAAPNVELPLFRGGGTVNINVLPLGAHTVILGSTGMGKSNTSGLFLEKIHSLPDPATGGCAIPTFIEDFQGEHLGIFEIYPENVHFVEEIIEDKWQEEVKKNVFKTIYKTFGQRDAQKFCAGRTTYHFDVSTHIREMGQVKQYLYDFISECIKLKTEEYNRLKPLGKKPRPHFFYWSEAHNFFPETFSPEESDEELAKNLKRLGIAVVEGGRKLGMPSAFDSQRPARLDKDLSSQCLNRILLPVIDRPDLEYYMMLMTKIPVKRLIDVLSVMRKPENRGQAIINLITSGPGLDIQRFYKKESRDMGGTPNFSDAIDWEYMDGHSNSPHQNEREEHIPYDADPYSVLQVNRTATNSELKAAYRRQCNAWHPDRYPENSEAAKEAEEMMKKTNLAWENIRRERGFN